MARRSSADSLSHTAHSPHLNTHRSGSPPDRGSVRLSDIGLPQCGQGGWTGANSPVGRIKGIASMAGLVSFVKRSIEIQTFV
jgi:hypothetical protein